MEEIYCFYLVRCYGFKLVFLSYLGFSHSSLHILSEPRKLLEAQLYQTPIVIFCLSSTGSLANILPLVWHF